MKLIKQSQIIRKNYINTTEEEASYYKAILHDLRTEKQKLMNELKEEANQYGFNLVDFVEEAGLNSDYFE